MMCAAGGRAAPCRKAVPIWSSPWRPPPWRPSPWRHGLAQKLPASEEARMLTSIGEHG